MVNIQNHIIKQDDIIINALDQLDKLPKTLTLFVVNDQMQMVGTLTDGDVRRGFLNGRTLEEPVSRFVKQNFFYLQENKIDVNETIQIKSKGVRLLPVLNSKGEIVHVYDLNQLESVLPLEAVIMAGGRGQRLSPITDTIPKPLIKLGDKPIIEHNIDRLISFGIEKIYITVNYLKDQIMDYFGDGTSKGIKIEYIQEDKPLGTAGALSLISDIKTDFLLLNSDLFTSVDYEDIYLAFLREKADLVVASIPYNVNIPYAVLFEEEGRINRFEEKPSTTYYANAGIYVIKKELLEAIPENTFYNATDLMQYVIDSDKVLIHNPLVGYWIDIGKHEDLNRAKEIIKHL